MCYYTRTSTIFDSIRCLRYYSRHWGVFSNFLIVLKILVINWVITTSENSCILKTGVKLRIALLAGIRSGQVVGHNFYCTCGSKQLLVACTRLYTPLCRSVGPSVHPSVRRSVRPSVTLYFFIIKHQLLFHFKSFKVNNSHSESF